LHKLVLGFQMGDGKSRREESSQHEELHFSD
jgi:hypothetical protein